jgi:hypothetical protein
VPGSRRGLPSTGCVLRRLGSPPDGLTPYDRPSQGKRRNCRSSPDSDPALATRSVKGMSHATQPARLPVAGRPQRARIPVLINLTYAAALYLLFLAVLGDAAGFFAGRGVPTGPHAAAPVAVAIGLLLLLLFAVQYTVMARPWFKRRRTRIVPEPAGRTSFVLAASPVLALLFWLWRPVRPVLWSLPGPGACALRAAYAAGPSGGCQVHLPDQPRRPVRDAAGPVARAARLVPSRAIQRVRRVRARPGS